jgi:hypothetical protein
LASLDELYSMQLIISFSLKTKVYPLTYSFQPFDISRSSEVYGRNSVVAETEDGHWEYEVRVDYSDVGQNSNQD